MLSGNCTEALSIQANVTISCSSARLIKNGIAPLPFPLPALLKQYSYIKRGERVRVRGHAPFYATLGFSEGVPVMLINLPPTTCHRHHWLRCSPALSKRRVSSRKSSSRADRSN